MLVWGEEKVEKYNLPQKRKSLSSIEKTLLDPGGVEIGSVNVSGETVIIEGRNLIIIKIRHDQVFKGKPD